MKTRYKVTKQQLEMVVESFVTENSNRRTRRMNEAKLNEIFGLGKKFEELMKQAKERANKYLDTLSDEEKEELANSLIEKSPKAAREVQNASSMDSLLPSAEEAAEIADETGLTTESLKLNEVGSGKFRQIFARLVALVGAPLSAALAIAGIAGDAAGWADSPWSVVAHDFINMFGQARGFVVILGFLLFLVCVMWGSFNFNVAKQRAAEKERAAERERKRMEKMANQGGKQM
jgi:hypothetical protein